MNNINEHNFDEQPDLPQGENGKNPFGMPQDYFSLFEDRLKKKLEAEDELKGFPLLNSINRQNVFTVPENYFNVLENALVHKAELTDFTRLGAIPKPLLRQPEENYFDEAAVQIQNKLAMTDELRPFKALHEFDKISPFDVPVNYFEDLTLHIKDKIYQIKEERASITIQLLEFIFGKKMVISFGLIVLVGLFFFIYQRTNDVVEVTDCKTLACLEKQEIIDQNGLSRLDEEQLIELVDVKTLDKQLKSIVTVDTLQNEEYILEELNTDQLIEEL